MGVTAHGEGERDMSPPASDWRPSRVGIIDMIVTKDTSIYASGSCYIFKICVDVTCI